MGKPTESILGGDERQSCRNRLLEIFACTSTYPSQKGLQFGEGFLDRRKIRRIGWQKQEKAPLRFDGLSDARSQVDREIIQNHGLSGVQAGSQDLLDVDLKGRAICGSVQDQCFSHALYRQGSKQRHVRPVIAGNLAHSSLSSGSIGIQGSHGNMRTCFIHKDQILTDEVADLLTPSRMCGFILLACPQSLFFRVQPRAILARLMLAGLTLMPYLASNSWQCSSRLASGWVSSCASKLACNSAPFFAGRPGIAFGRT